MLKRIAHAVGRRIGLRPARRSSRHVGAVFDNWARDGRSEKMERAHGPVVRRLLGRVELGADAHYLDIGCGNGYSVRWMSSRLPNGRAVGLDASAEMVAHAQELSEGMPNVAFQRAEFPDHTLERGRFDLIFSMETMYYMVDVDAALRETLALLGPGGIFISAIDFYRENRASHRWPGYVRTEMKLLSARRWRRAFRRAGFQGVTQRRLILPRTEAVESWHSTVGCLVTRGARA